VGLLCFAPRAGELSDDARLTFVCLTSVFVAYIGPMSRTERHRKTKIGTEVADVTNDSDTIFEVKRSKVNLHIVAASRTACYISCAPTFQHLNSGATPGLAKIVGVMPHQANIALQLSTSKLPLVSVGDRLFRFR